MEANVDVTTDVPRRFVDAFNARDLDGLRALITEDAEFRNRNGKSFTGWDGARDVLTAAEDARLTLVPVGAEQAEDDRVTLPVKVVLGRDELHGNAVFEVRDGKIAA